MEPLTVTFTGSALLHPAQALQPGAYSGTFKGQSDPQQRTDLHLHRWKHIRQHHRDRRQPRSFNGATVGEASVTITTGWHIHHWSLRHHQRQPHHVQSLTEGARLPIRFAAATALPAVWWYKAVPHRRPHAGSGTPSCAGNIIKGSLRVAEVTLRPSPWMETKSAAGVQVRQSNSAATTIDGNTIGASLQKDQSNTGPTQVFTNVIANALQCPVQHLHHRRVETPPPTKQDSQVRKVLDSRIAGPDNNHGSPSRLRLQGGRSTLQASESKHLSRPGLLRRTIRGGGICPENWMIHGGIRASRVPGGNVRK